jgi:hypothetical protein
MPHPIPDHVERKDFFSAAPPSTGDDSTGALRAWLATADFLLGDTGRGDSCSVLVLVCEESDELSVYAIPDTEISEAMRADLDRAHRANFELFFTGDLDPQQFAGALWCLSLTEVEGARSLRQDLEAEIAGYDTPIDWPAVDAAWGTWVRHELQRGGALPGPVSHIYAGNYAP